MSRNIEALHFRSCTLDELIEALEDARETHGGEAQVAFSSDYGDYTHTQQLHRIRGDVDERQMVDSAYSQSGVALVPTEAEDEDDPDGDNPPILVIS